MSTDFRALCADLLWALENAIRIIYREDGTRHISTADPIVTRARAALAQPEPEVVGPTDEELDALWFEIDGRQGLGWKSFARAVLARFGHQPEPPAEGEVAELVEWLRGANWDGKRQSLATRAADLLERQARSTPVPVAERLPGAEDCDAEGRCWLHLPDMGTEPLWRLTDPSMRSRYHSHWLPANALPLPAGEVAA